VESIVEGTWGGSSPVPAEYVDYRLMLEMHWSWDDLQTAPPYVRRFCHDFRQIEIRVENERAESERSRIEAQQRQYGGR
jgi:hypothetical protein